MVTANHNLETLLNEHEVARLLRVSVATIRRRRQLGQAPIPVRIGASVRYAPQTIRQLIKGGEKEADA